MEQKTTIKFFAGFSQFSTALIVFIIGLLKYFMLSLRACSTLITRLLCT
jgi:hypothetical protein